MAINDSAQPILGLDSKSTLVEIDKRPPTCRFCGSPLEKTFVDLGCSPLANSFLSAEALNQMEPFYPLHVYVCESCLLVQIEAFEKPEEIFGDYAYFSSYSDSWLLHAETYTKMMINRFGIDRNQHVVEIGSNDGYLLQYFTARGIPVLGVEPASNVAKVAQERGIPTRIEFFSLETARKLAEEGLFADLLVGNNVLAHVPNLNDFVAGLNVLLKSNGVLTMEFPHLMRLMEENQFDTIYHEHFSYFTFHIVREVFRKQGLTIFDVEELPTHGGSLRIYARHTGDRSKAIHNRVNDLLSIEEGAGLTHLNSYLSFRERVQEIKRKLLTFLIQAREGGKSIVGYGAPAKGNTLLNYCGVRSDMIDYTVDRSPHKQGLYLPGTHIPIFDPSIIWETKPDYVLILPWNLRDEIIEQLASIRVWGAQFVIPIPEVKTL